MTTTYVTFDTRSGQILIVHHGAADATEARKGAQYSRQPDAKIGDEHIGVIPVFSEAIDNEKLYKVDVGNKVLVAASAEHGGVGFGFGEADRSSRGA